MSSPCISSRPVRHIKYLILVCGCFVCMYVRVPGTSEARRGCGCSGTGDAGGCQLSGWFWALISVSGPLEEQAAELVRFQPQLTSGSGC